MYRLQKNYQFCRDLRIHAILGDRCKLHNVTGVGVPNSYGGGNFDGDGYDDDDDVGDDVGQVLRSAVHQGCPARVCCCGRPY